MSFHCTQQKSMVDSDMLESESCTVSVGGGSPGDGGGGTTTERERERRPWEKEVAGEEN